MKIYTLARTQDLPISIHEAWDFFSNPNNLSKITPDEMAFTVTSDLPEQMYPGLIITYIVKPLLGIPLNWVTEITQIDPPNYFIDEQRFGPYKFWHHTHFFKEIDEGVRMEDRVWYGLPFGFFGNIAQPIIVKKKLSQIFDFRNGILEKRFGKL